MHGITLSITQNREQILAVKANVRSESNIPANPDGEVFVKRSALESPTVGASAGCNMQTVKSEARQLNR